LGTGWIALNRPGDGSNDEAQCYRPANVVEAGGSLIITSKVDSSCAGHRYTSGMVQWKTANFTFGTLEFRARFAGGVGTWPAVWMLGAGCQKSNASTPDNVGTCNWPGPGSQEIDVAEIYGGGRTSVHQGLITATGTSGCNATTTDVSTNWHVYKLVWAPGSLTWKIDGRTTCTVRENVPITPMFVMINTALGGSSGGTIIDSTLPAQTFVDYLRVTK
jgi:beta-glucanase (GH16 family)